MPQGDKLWPAIAGQKPVLLLISHTRLLWRDVKDADEVSGVSVHWLQSGYLGLVWNLLLT